jgi:uncharacterized membrane protein
MRGTMLANAVLLFLLLPLAVSAATIHGTVYTIELDTVHNALVSINTQPRQSFIAANGTYSFSVPDGQYTLTALVIENGNVTARADEPLTVKGSGDYVLDLIAFPDTSDAEGILNLTDEINFDEAQLTTDHTLLYLGIGAAIVVVGIGAWLFLRRMPQTAQQPVHTVTKEPPAEFEGTPSSDVVAALPATERDDAQEILNFIKSQDGRTTQKDIRKHSPLSEAKISLIVSELEHKGVIEKIKKGRGNIIVLK